MPLLNLNFLCGFADDDRNFVMDDCPPARVYVFKRRLPMMHRDGWDGNKASSRMNTAWFVWERDEAGNYGSATIGYTKKQASAWCRKVERAWRRFAWNPKECDLAGKATIADMAEALLRSFLATGEGFAVLDQLPLDVQRRLGLTVGLKVSILASHRCPRTTNESEGLDQGVYHDELNRAIGYKFRVRKNGIETDRTIDGADVIHVMDRAANLNSPRGISVIAAVLKVIAQSDQLADATLATALMQTIFAATIKSPEPSETAFDAIRTLSEMEPPEGYEGDWGAFIGGLQEDLMDVWATMPAVELCAVNPARDIPYFKTGSEGYHSWTADEVDQFIAKHPIGTKAYLALMLMLYTSQRRSDIVLFGKQHMTKGWLRFVQEKDKKRKPRRLEMPLHPNLVKAIEAGPCGELTLLVTEFNKPFTSNGFGNWFRKRCNEAELTHCSAHGLRKAAAARLADRGATEHQIMAITGHTTSKEVIRYTKAARQKVLAKSAVKLMDQAVDDSDD